MIGGGIATGALIAMVIGVLGTSVIHLSKGVMKLGISRLQAVPEAAPPALPAALIYAVGIGMNFTNPLWVIVANRFAPTIYYTSMYGLGLIALLLFSRYVLREKVQARQITGVALIMLGTLVIGLFEFTRNPPSLYGASRFRVILVAGLWLAAAPLAALLVRRRAIALQEVVFGIAAGGMAALEAVVKGVAQAGALESTFLPRGGANWALFIVSFLGAAGAFGMIQWSFLRRCRASMMGAVYTATYAAVPLMIVPFLLGTAGVSAGCLAGIGLLVLGALMVSSPSHTAPRSDPPGRSAPAPGGYP